jgi:hypothetical protein
MIFNIKTIIDWRMITARKQKQVIKDNLRENKGWIDHQYSVGASPGPRLKILDRLKEIKIPK